MKIKHKERFTKATEPASGEKRPQYFIMLRGKKTILKDPPTLDFIYEE